MTFKAEAHLAVARGLLAVVLLGSTACLDSAAPVSHVDPLPGIIVSPPVAASNGTLTSRFGSASLDDGSLVYVSLVPGSVPGGQQAMIRNQSSGASVTTAVVNGGFDPVAIPGSVGNTLLVEISRSAGAILLRGTSAVRPKRPPAIVRTNPPRGGRDVPLNTTIVIVFSTPIDSTTLTTGTVQLWRGTTPVSGAVLRSDFAGIRAEFRPDSLLTVQTEYHLVVTQQIRDVNGIPVDSAVTVSFTTGSTPPATGLSFAAVTAGFYHTCGVTTAGAAYCWGTNGNGELGLGNLNPGRLTAVPVVGGLSFVAVDAGGARTCGITADGAAYCWGENLQGRLGVGTTTDFQQSPAPVTGGLSFVTLSVGGAHTCGVTAAGAAYCWGANVFGELGDATTIDRSSPVLVEGGMIFTEVSPGGAHTCGITAAGAAYCWGHNEYGQLGDGTTTDRSVPGLVAGGLSFTTVSAADHHTCGLTATGAAYCWGYNGMGQLGDGTKTDRSSPVLVAGDLSFTVLRSTIAYQTCAVTAAGAAYCWGINGVGQLGDGTTTNRSSPAPVAGGLNFASVSTGYFHTCGISVAGVTYCWGDNGNFQLGDGTGSSSSVPVKVAGQP